MLVLSILHNIFLNETEIESLTKGEEIETIGVSVPVWYYEGNTSEPAEEVFCKYKISINNKKESVSISKNGYTINFPKLPNNYEEKKLSDERASKMTEEQVEKWYKENPKLPNINELYKNGETHFKKHTKKKQKGKLTNLVHCVEVSKINKLTNTLTSS